MADLRAQHDAAISAAKSDAAEQAELATVAMAKLRQELSSSARHAAAAALARESALREQLLQAEKARSELTSEVGRLERQAADATARARGEAARANAEASRAAALVAAATAEAAVATAALEELRAELAHARQEHEARLGDVVRAGTAHMAMVEADMEGRVVALRTLLASRREAAREEEERYVRMRWRTQALRGSSLTRPSPCPPRPQVATQHRIPGGCPHGTPGPVQAGPRRSQRARDPAAAAAQIIGGGPRRGGGIAE